MKLSICCLLVMVCLVDCRPMSHRRHVERHSKRNSPPRAPGDGPRSGETIDEYFLRVNFKTNPDGTKSSPIEKGYRLEELDIMVPIASSKRSIPTNRTGKARWPGGIVPYVISYEMYTSEIYALQKATQLYKDNTCLRLVPRTTEKCRTARREEELEEIASSTTLCALNTVHRRNYLKLIKANGCWSFLGYHAKPAQEVSIGRGCEYPDIIFHEFMHAIGFGHEQTRFDRDKYVRINFANIDYGANNFRLDPNYGDLNSKYDYLSIMHYGKTAFSDYNKITIKTLDRTMQDRIGQSETPSQTDYDQLNSFYSEECKMPPSTTTTTTTTTTTPTTTTTTPTTTTPTPTTTTPTTTTTTTTTTPPPTTSPWFTRTTTTTAPIDPEKVPDNWIVHKGVAYTGNNLGDDRQILPDCLQWCVDTRRCAAVSYNTETHHCWLHHAEPKLPGTHQPANYYAYERTQCGNGKVDEGEECDDGGSQDGDGCTATCTFEVCKGTVCYYFKDARTRGQTYINVQVKSSEKLRGESCIMIPYHHKDVGSKGTEVSVEGIVPFTASIVYQRSDGKWRSVFRTSVRSQWTGVYRFADFGKVDKFYFKIEFAHQAYQDELSYWVHRKSYPYNQKKFWRNKFIFGTVGHISIETVRKPRNHGPWKGPWKQRPITDHRLSIRDDWNEGFCQYEDYFSEPRELVILQGRQYEDRKDGPVGNMIWYTEAINRNGG